MDINSLKELYNNGNIEECLKQLEIYLLINPENIDALSLNASCIKEFVYAENNPEETDIYSLLEPTFECYDKILTIDPVNEAALLDSIELASYHITNINYQTYIDRADKLMEIATTPESLKKALYFKSLLNETHEHFEEALLNLDDLVALQKEIYKDDRIIRDNEVSTSIIQKTNILRYALNEPQKAVGIFKEYFKYFTSDTAYLFIDIALLGIEQKDYVLAGKAAERALLTPLNYDEEITELTNLYPQIEEAINNGVTNKGLITSYLLSQRILQEDLGISTADVILNAQSYIKQYPDWFVPHHFTGAALFSEQEYTAALPFIEKALKLGGYSITIMRYVQCHYYVNGTIPSIPNWPDDEPRDYYNIGVDFGDFESTITNALISKDLIKIRIGFYDRALKGFKNYFEQDKYDADFYTSHHLVAMCCNNYGIALRDAFEYEKSISVLKEGLTHSDFWELHYSLAESYFYSQQYSKALETLNTVLEYKIEYSSPPNYFKVLSRKVISLYQLDKKTEAEELFKILETDYNNTVDDVDKKDLDASEITSWNQASLEIQNARHTLLKDLSSEEVIKKWQVELEKNPDDNSNWYMLMQHYYQLKDYKNCIDCANNYEAVKPANELALSDYKKLHFMRGNSLLQLQQNEKALDNFNKLTNCYKGELSDIDHSELSSIRNSMAKAYFNKQQWEDCMLNANESLKIFEKMNWNSNAEWLSSAMIYVDAAQKSGHDSFAKTVLKNILAEFPDNEEAKERLKEVKKKTGWSFFRRK